MNRKIPYYFIILLACYFVTLLITDSSLLNSLSLLPPFTEVVKTFYRLVVSGVLLENFSSSLFRVLAGFISGSIAGIVVGIIMGSNKLVEKTFHPIFSILLPIARPSIFTGLKLEAGMAWRVIIAAEMVAIPTGIGANADEGRKFDKEDK